MVTAQDVADLAGVSRATVSYVMNGSDLISKTTKKHVLQAVAELGYHPNGPARALAGGRTGFIGVAIQIDSSTSSVELSPHLTTVITETEKKNNNVLLIPGQEGLPSIRRIVKQSTLDGLLVYDIQLHEERLAELEKLHIPCVLVGTTLDQTSIPSVDIDYAKMVEILVDELIGIGCNEIVFIDNKVDDSNRFNFSKAFSEGGPIYAKSCGVKYKTCFIGDSHWQGIGQATQGIATWHRRKVGVAVRTPGILDLLVAMLRINQITPGKDIPVVAICPNSFAATQPVPITNVDPLAEQCSMVAVHKLYALLDDVDPTPKRELITPILQRRYSTSFQYD